jgi:hypothetical protein
MVGLSAVVSLRLLGVAAELPLSGMRKLLPWIWVGFWVNAISGTLLIISEPAKMLTNQIFVAKMGLIACAVATIVMTGRFLRSSGEEGRAVGAKGRTLAVATLVLWVAATTAGRLTAYIGATIPL